MNFSHQKIKKVKKRRNSNFVNIALYTPTNIPFWADITTSSNYKQNPKLKLRNKINTSIANMSKTKRVQESIEELMDDNSPSAPFAESSAESSKGLIQTSNKPSLNIQDRTQEKIKFSQKCDEKVNMEHDKHEAVQNIQQNVIEDEKQNAEENVVHDTKQKVEQNLKQKAAENEKKNEKFGKKAENISYNKKMYKPYQSEINKQTNMVKEQSAPIPVLSNQTSANINNQNYSQSAGMAIPTLNNHGYTLMPQGLVQLSTVQQQIYENVHSFGDPNILAINNMILQRSMGMQPTFQNMHPYQNPNAIPEYMHVNTAPVYAMPAEQPPPMFGQQPAPANYMTSNFAPNTPMFVNTDIPKPTSILAYSPSDTFVENPEEGNNNIEEIREGSSSPEIYQSGHKRLSAFKRLGPLTQPKKHKLTINLNFDREEPIREVVGEAQDTSATETFVPVHERKDIINSTDKIVKKYLIHWPWKNYVHVKRSVGARTSKSAMMMEQEQMEEIYERDNTFTQLTVKGYPKTWSKEDVLDTLLENLDGKNLIPCFIEFSPHECKFLVLRSRMALVAIHKLGFCVQRNDVTLNITISNIALTLKNLDFLPKIILRKRVLMGLDNETKLSLKAFTLQPDISHFLYFPLNLVTHQIDITELDCYIDWKNLVELDLSNNRLTTLEGFILQRTTPHLRSLDLSNNYIDKITVLLPCRDLPIRSLKLEGNPLCTNYTDPNYYVKVLKMIFPMLKEIDDVPITYKGDIPLVRKNFSLPEADVLVEKFLEMYFPIIDNPPHERGAIEEMYDNNAILTITHRPKLSQTSMYRKFHSLFFFNRYRGRHEDSFKSPQNIAKLLRKWPDLLHDPSTFTVDVMWHSDSTTLLRVGGVVKITSESLAVDEYILAFSRTILLHTTNGFEYKIRNEMLYWDLPTEDFTKNAFRIAIPRKILNIALETPPDQKLKESLIHIFMILTELERKPSNRCLEENDWNLKNALKVFIKLVKSNKINTLYDVSPTESLKENVL